MLFVATTYSRVLVALAIIIAEALVWLGIVRKLFYPALGFRSGQLPQVGMDGSDTRYLILLSKDEEPPNHSVPREIFCV